MTIKETATDKEPALFDFALKAMGGFRLSDIEETEERDKWIIPGFVTRTNTLLYGEAGTGKSFLVCHMIKALLGGGKFLGTKPLDTLDWVLILASDAGARIEYRERLDKIGVPVDKVGIIERVNAEDVARLSDEEGWVGGSLMDAMHLGGEGLVVLDHATGVIEGDINNREPWMELWRGLIEPLNVPTVVVGHTTSAGRNTSAKKAMGNSANVQFARCQINVWGDPLRHAEVHCRYIEPFEVEFRIVDGVVVPGKMKKQERDTATLNFNLELSKLAIETPGEKIKDVCEAILERANAIDPGTQFSKPDSIRSRLNRCVEMGLIQQADKDSDYRYVTGPKFPA